MTEAVSPANPTDGMDPNLRTLADVLVRIVVREMRSGAAAMPRESDGAAPNPDQRHHKHVRDPEASAGRSK